MGRSSPAYVKSKKDCYDKGAGPLDFVSQVRYNTVNNNERKQMEIVSQDSYNPHALTTVREIQPESNDSIYKLYKATELEDLLFANPTIKAYEHLPNGELREWTLNRADISEMFRKAQYRDARLESQEKQIGQIIDNLTIDSWFSDTVDKEEVLRDLCVILDHEPKQTMNWTVTLTVSGSTEVDITEVNDFDIRYHLSDNLSVDSNDFTTEVDSWDIDLVDSQDWN
jgi:hypothetical protein